MADNLTVKDGSGGSVVLSARDEGGGVLSSRTTLRQAGSDVGTGNALFIQSNALPLPTGAATSALQTTANTSLATLALETGGNLATIATNTAQGTKTSGSSMPSGGVGFLGWLSAIANYLAGTLTISGTANSVDPSATTGTITAADAASTTVTNSIGQSIITGSPTAASFVNVTLSGHTVASLQLSGTDSTVVAFERSVDGGTTWFPMSMEQTTVGAASSTLTMSDNKPYELRGACGGLTNLRVRCTSYVSGTLTVKWQPSWGVNQIAVNQGVPNSAANAWTIQSVVGTLGGATPLGWISDGTVYQQVVKASAGLLYKLSVSNAGTSNIYLRVYDKATNPAPASDTPKMRFVIPPGGREVAIADQGCKFSNGISYVLTSGSFADTDVAAVAANTGSVTAQYN